MAKYVWRVWQSMLQFLLWQSMFVVQFNSSTVAFSSLVKYVWCLHLCCCCVAPLLMLSVIHVDIYMLSVNHHLNMIMHRTHLTSLRMITDNHNAWLVFLEDSMDQINSLQFAAQGRILEEAGSCCSICDTPLEPPAHIMFECNFARCFWSMLGPTPADTTRPVSAASTCPLPPSAPRRTVSMLWLLCLWHFWKHRNRVVFNGDHSKKLT
jgi:hypothetical protein